MLESSWFTMLFQVYKKVIQLYTCPLTFLFFSQIGYYRILSGVSYTIQMLIFFLIDTCSYGNRTTGTWVKALEWSGLINDMNHREQMRRTGGFLPPNSLPCCQIE